MFYGKPVKRTSTRKMFGIKVIVGAIVTVAICNMALGQIIIEPDQPVNCTGDFVKERCSNECDRPSCYDLAFGPSICPMYCTEFCVCKDGMVFDDCERDCRLPKDCSSAERTYACVFPDEVDGDSTDGANPAVDGTPGDV